MGVAIFGEEVLSMVVGSVLSSAQVTDNALISDSDVTVGTMTLVMGESGC